MALPSSCGWPDQTNTGVPKSVALTVHSGNWTINKAGTVIDGYDIKGCVVIQAANVVIKRSKITCPDFVAVKILSPTGSPEAANANLLIEDSEIVLSKLGNNGVAWDGYTLRRVWIHGGSDCATADENVVIEHSFCDIPAGLPVGSAHVDGFQDGGDRIVWRHNTIRNPYAQVSAIYARDTAHATIVDNLVAGGGWTIYCPKGGTLDAFSGNVISRKYYSTGGSYGPTDACPSSGWRWDGTVGSPSTPATVVPVTSAPPAPTTTAPVPTTPAPTATVGLQTVQAYITGYSWFDNTPAGSADISHPVRHQVAGGTGTYEDPITVAVGHSIVDGQDILDWPAGTKFYVPNLRRYFIVEDSCGDGGTPQNGPCHQGYPSNASTWLDVWVGGAGGTEAQADACMGAITKVSTAYVNPPSGLPVVAGDIYSPAGCAVQYGDILP